MTEEEQLEYALRMSLAQSGQTSQAVSTPAMDEDMKEVSLLNHQITFQ